MTPLLGFRLCIRRRCPTSTRAWPWRLFLPPNVGHFHGLNAHKNIVKIVPHPRRRCPTCTRAWPRRWAPPRKCWNTCTDSPRWACVCGGGLPFKLIKGPCFQALLLRPFALPVGRATAVGASEKVLEYMYRQSKVGVYGGWGLPLKPLKPFFRAFLLFSGWGGGLPLGPFLSGRGHGTRSRRRPRRAGRAHINAPPPPPHLHPTPQGSVAPASFEWAVELRCVTPLTDAHIINGPPSPPPHPLFK